jgi:hypothetical protein
LGKNLEKNYPYFIFRIENYPQFTSKTVGLILTIIGFVFIYGQIHEMRKQREQNQVEVKLQMP